MTETLTTLPSPSGPLQIPTNSIPTPSEKAVDSSGEIRCICDYADDDGYTICCDECETWQHYVCMGLPPGNAPSKYKCPRCSPRPVDAKKAREIQRIRRQEDDERTKTTTVTTTTTTTKRKRTTGVSHKKKDSHAGVSVSSGKSGSNAEKNGHGKTTSPRESQPTTSRKRNARGNGHHSSAAGSPGYFPDRNDDDDADADKYKFEFTDISNQSDRYSSDEVKNYLLEAADPSNTAYNKFVKHLTRSEFSTPKASVRSIPDHSKAFSVYPPFGFVLDAPCAKGKPVALFKGEVGMQDAYMNHPPNQYAVLHHPKTYVIFHPDLHICIDARNWGTEARFARRSCRPNCSIAALVLEDAAEPKVAFALYANEALKAGTEVTIGWDWDSTPLSKQLAHHDFDFSKISAEELFQVATWVNNLLENTTCACNGGDECLLARIKKQSGIPSPKPPTTGGRGKRKVPTPPISKEPTPSIHDEMDIDSRADSVPKRKSRSRDLTPHDTAVEPMPMTNREERKFKDMLSRIEKQTLEDNQAQGTKRRKRTRTVSGVSVNGAGLKVEKSRTSKNSRGGSPLVIEVADASTGRRRTSGSSTGSDSHTKAGKKSVRSPSMSVVSTSKGFTTRKVVAQAAKATYTDSAMQTEADDDIPWWRSPEKRMAIQPCEPRIPLRKRLMQLMLANREVPPPVPEEVEKKRKHEEVTAVEESASSPPKMVKVMETFSKRIDVDDVSLPSPTITISVPPAPAPATSSDSSTSSKSASPAVPNGTPAVPPKVDENISTKIDQNQRSGSVGLHLNLPPPGLPNNTSNSGSTPSSTSTTPVFSPSILSSIGGTAQPSPTRLKKLSLGDYSKRKHKVAEAALEKKDDDHSKPTTESTLNILHTDQRKLVAPMTSTSSAPTPSAKPNSWSVR
ncbi:hypothetical protein EX30DRAFT_192247 [Ascodesmis nigricans]|uniref:SET domain-containing protein n=1 Tax=Ascodesmis nigricans TaxID=341454 RepID=A0A4S2N0I2_9PEZI|nr:hypothetical protein EX30DRAFT_192247 [Ascodesmis nigricans]